MAVVIGAEGMESRECTDALDDEGYILGYPNANGQVAKCPANGAVYGVAYKSTKHPITGDAEANKQVAIVHAPKIAYLQFNNGAGETIAVGDLLSTKGANAAGTCKKHASTAWPATYSASTAETISDEFSMIVGIALEAKGENTSGKVKCLLLCPIPPKQ